MATLSQKLAVLHKVLECNRKDYSKSLSTPEIIIHINLTPGELDQLQDILIDYEEIKRTGQRPAEKIVQSALFPEVENAKK